MSLLDFVVGELFGIFNSKKIGEDCLDSKSIKCCLVKLYLIKHSIEGDVSDIIT